MILVFNYVCGMKFRQKNIFNCIILVLSMLVCFDVCFQENKISSLVELSTDNSSVIDSDFIEDELFQCTLEFLPQPKITTQHEHFHVLSSEAQPFLPVWQPPKLS